MESARWRDSDTGVWLNPSSRYVSRATSCVRRCHIDDARTAAAAGQLADASDASDGARVFSESLSSAAWRTDRRH